jgi:hypothetical protein
VRIANLLWPFRARCAFYRVALSDEENFVVVEGNVCSLHSKYCMFSHKQSDR